MANPGDPSQFQTPFDLQVANTPNFINSAYSTPSQRAQLYAMSNELMKPSDIHNGWQGLASIARSLVGGYEGHLADQYEAGAFKGAQGDVAATLGNLSSNMATGGAPAGAAAPPPAAPASGNYDDTQAGHDSFIRSYAASRGVDPDFASAVAHGEGLGALSAKNPNSASSVDIDPKTGKPFSFGDFQLNVRNGLGNTAKASGIDPADPSQWQAADKFSIDYMADHGTQPWKGDAGMKAYGVGDNGSWSAPKAGGAANPAVAAIGHALMAGPGASSQPPMNPQALAHALVNPNIPDATRTAIIQAATPQAYKDANNNTSYGSQFQRPQAPVYAGGRLQDVTPGTLPTIVSGPLNAPKVTPTIPAGTSAGAGSDGSDVTPDYFGPSSTLGRLGAQAAETATHNEGVKAAGAASTDQFTKDRLAAANFQRSSLPLQKAIPLLEKLGPQGTGPGSEGFNQVLSFLQTAGVQVGDPDKIKSFDELNKYLTDFVNQNGDHSTNDKMAASFAGNPSVHISNAAALDVAKTAMAMTRYKQGMYQAASQAGVPPEKYADFTNDYQSKIDPRAFGMDMMSPAAAAQLKTELGPPSDNTPARQKFMASLSLAQRLGLVQKPQAQQQ